MRAARLLEKGYSEAEVARRVGVHRQSVNRWARSLRAGGLAALRRAERAGRRPKLSEADLVAVEQCLKQGPGQFGYHAKLWTLPRVRQLIEERYGVRYHPSQVWRILHKLNRSCQRPNGRALERGEEGHRPLQIKKKRFARRAPSSLSARAG
jgi:transposase